MDVDRVSVTHTTTPPPPLQYKQRARHTRLSRSRRTHAQLAIFDAQHLVHRAERALPNICKLLKAC